MNLPATYTFARRLILFKRREFICHTDPTFAVGDRCTSELIPVSGRLFGLLVRSERVSRVR